jgi:hypothetical protein
VIDPGAGYRHDVGSWQRPRGSEWDMASESGSGSVGFSLEHITEVVKTPGVIGSKYIPHAVRLERPAEGIRATRLVCPTCEQHFLVDVRSLAATRVRERKLLVAGLVVALVLVGVWFLDGLLSGFWRLLIVGLGGLFVALPLLLGSRSTKGGSGFRRVAPDGTVTFDLDGHRLM